MPKTLSFRAAEYGPTTRQSAHDHEGVQISIVLRGSVAETVGRATEYAGALSVVVKDRGLRHANEFGPRGATIAQLALPEGGLSELVEDPRRVVEWTWSHNLAAVTPFLRLVDRYRATGTDAFTADDADVVDLVSAVSARREERRHEAPPAWLADSVAWLRAEWHPRMTVSDVAARARVHPVYLARCVRRWYGHSLSDELRRLRLRAAAHGVAVHADELSRVASDTGYADQAHLCRDFRRATGFSPGGYRVVVRDLIAVARVS